ncbi:MAG: OadG family transporter subunit [Eubacteriales bacterium]|nr:OadG family transporter subunit [Eubacteriales bacterium]
MNLAGSVTIVGLTVVFAALILLALIISLFSLLTGRKMRKALASTAAASAASAAAGYAAARLSAGNSRTKAQSKEPVKAEDIIAGSIEDDRIAAAITAAIYAYYEENSTNFANRFGIIVKSFRRAPAGASAWNMAGRHELLIPFEGGADAR